jgi:DnaK suppressor protein
MPTKNSHKATKKPGKATPKGLGPKKALLKKPVQPPTKATAKPLSKTAPKATVKPSKPPQKSTAKPPAAKTRAAKPDQPKPEPKAVAPKPAVPKSAPPPPPVKFDIRPLVMPRAVQNDDGDSDSPASASLLAGPRNVKPYIARRGEQYMNKEQLDHFARILQTWKRDLMVEVDRTVLHMKDEAANFPDPNDRATQEEEFSLELRTRDRERKLIRKIDEALKRIEDGSYGYCLETGEEIGIKRLEARPVATLSVEAQERRERREKQYGDRDDRYR